MLSLIQKIQKILLPFRKDTDSEFSLKYISGGRRATAEKTKYLSKRDTIVYCTREGLYDRVKLIQRIEIISIQLTQIMVINVMYHSEKKNYFYS